MGTAKPIYDYIKEHVVDGKLPAGFNLDEYSDGDGHQIRMADGAMDGIFIYHMMHEPLDDDVASAIAHALEVACAGDYASASEALSGLLAEHRAIAAIDQVQQAVFDIAPRVDAEDLFAYASYNVLTSTDKEMVKLGLSILEVFNEPQEPLKEAVRTLALSDEFAVFCAWNARAWANGNDEVFSIARRVEGWGRVHAVEMLEPATDEIRDWLLYEGVNNAVLPEYSALTCYEKAGVADRLERELSHEEFSAITAIVFAMLNEGPVAGVSALEDPKTELARYVRQAAKQAARQALDLRDCECLDAMAERVEAVGWDDLASECETLLQTEAVRTLVAGEARKGRGQELARKLGVPFESAPPE